MSWLTRIFSKQPTPEQRPVTNTPALVTCGIYKDGKNLFLTGPQANMPGLTIKLVTISPELHGRYLYAVQEWCAVQDELQNLPTSLRPRRRSTRKAKEPEGVALEG
jgi:hypothetical protein